MKKRSLIIFSVLVVVMFLILMAYNILNIKITEKREAMNYYEKSYEYLYNKYGKEAKFTGDWSYYDSVYFYTVYFDNKDKQFQVRYVTTSSSFNDNYLLRLLDREVGELIENICHKYYDEVNCDTSIIHSIDDEKILESCYRNDQSLIDGIQKENKISLKINIYQNNNNQNDFWLILEDINKLNFTVDDVEFCLYNSFGKLKKFQKYVKINNNYQTIR